MTSLEPIGFDIPKAPQIVNAAPQALPQVDTTGLQVLSQSNQQIQQSLQAQAQFSAQSATSLQQTAEAASRSVSQVAASEAKVAQLKAEAAVDFSRSMQTFTGTIGNTIDQFAKARAAKDAAYRDAQKAAAIKELEDAQVDWIDKGRLSNEGTTAYRDVVTQTLGKYDLSSDDIGALTQRYYGPAVDQAKKAESNRQEAAAKVEQSRTDILVEQERIKASAAAGLVAASVSNSTPGVAQEAVQKLDGQIAELMANEQIPLGRRLTAAKEIYEVLSSSMAKRGEGMAAINEKKATYLRMSIVEAAAQAELKDGKITYEEYLARVRKEAVEQNVSWEPADPLRGEKYVQSVLQTNQSVQGLQEQERERKIAAINADGDTVVALATAFALDPTGYRNVKATDPKLLDRNSKVALEVFEDFEDFRTKFVPEYNRKKASLNLQIQQDRQQLDQWYVNASRDNGSAQSNPNFTKLLELARQGDPSLAAVDGGGRAPVTPEMAQRVYAAAGRVIQARVEEGSALDAEYQNRANKAAQYGLYLDVEQTKTIHKRYQQKREENAAKLREIQLQQFQLPGQSPNFNGGSPSKSGEVRPLARGTYGGQQITFPFPISALAGDLEPGQRFGDSRDGGRRSHAGLDFALPVGTPIQSLVYGKIQNIDNVDDNGAGINVEVLGDNGFIYRFLHLSRINMREGQRVAPGESFALSGNTGVGSGPHLHFEVYDPKTGLVDPLPHLASGQFGDASRTPRTAGSSPPPNAPPVFPAGAIPLGNGTYLLNGNVEKVSYKQGTITQQPARYSASAPIRSSYTRGEHLASQAPDANHGYAPLARDPQFARALNAVAAKHGMPGYMLADLIAYESANSFSTSKGNGLGFYGLIQFGPDARKDLGVTLAQLTSMTPTQQMGLVDEYLKMQKRYAGVAENTPIKNAAELIALVNLGGGVYKDVLQRGEAAVRDPRNNDGYIQLMEYLQRLGKFSGRKYDFPGNRQERLRASAVHTRPSVGCTMCEALVASAQFQPHENVS